MSPTARYAFRAALIGLAAAAASLQASLPLSGGDALQAVIAGIVALSAYLGIGAATPVEPNVGNKA